jgi:opacity protein-like surface antigen
MKTFRLLSALLLMGALRAQEGTLKIGAAILPQNTWLLNQDDSDAGPELDYEVTWGVAGGLTLAYNFTDYLGVGVDVLYSSQGQKYSGKMGGSGQDFTAHTKLSYLKLPLLFRFNSDPTSPVQFSFFVGPQLSFLTGYKDRVETSGSGITAVLEVSGTEAVTTLSGGGLTVTDKEELTAPAYKGTAFGVAFGLGTGFNITDNLQLTLHFRGDYAFGDAENKESKIDHTSHGGTGQDPFWEVKPKYNTSQSGAPAGYKRPATSAITGGLMLGITYSLPVR